TWIVLRRPDRSGPDGVARALGMGPAPYQFHEFQDSVPSPYAGRFAIEKLDPDASRTLADRCRSHAPGRNGAARFASVSGPWGVQAQGQHMIDGRGAPASDWMAGLPLNTAHAKKQPSRARGACRYRYCYTQSRVRTREM